MRKLAKKVMYFCSRGKMSSDRMFALVKCQARPTH